MAGVEEQRRVRAFDGLAELAAKLPPAVQVWAGGSVQVQSLKAAADLLQRLSQPFLNWAGKAERHQISVPTVPLLRSASMTASTEGGSAAIGASAEKPELFGRALILVGLAEGIAIYGLIVSILILNRLG